jgi:Glycosyltransferase family 87
MLKATRRWIVLLALYGTLIAGWLGFARGWAPAIIVAAHEGRSWPVLNGLVQGTGMPPPIEDSLQRWRNVSWAAAMAAVFHLLLVLFIDRLDCHDGDEREEIDQRVERWMNRALALLAMAFMALTVYEGAIQDYFLYLGMWRGIWTGHDPWAMTFGVSGKYPLNAYGPLFNVLAFPASINPLLPKLFFAAAYLAFAVWLLKVRVKGGRRSPWGRLVLLVWLFNPYLWVELAWYGHFDVLVGLCCVAAIAARTRCRDLLSGLWLGVGVLIKFMPIVLLPFLILDRQRFRLRLLAAALGVISMGFLISLVLWGTATLRPVIFAAGRTSEHLSIFRFLRGRYSPLRVIDFHEDLTVLAGPIVLLALWRAWSWSRRKEVDPMTSAVLAILVMLTFYPVGFPQYQMVLFLLASYWLTREGQSIRNRGLLYIALGFHFGWLATFDVIGSIVDIDSLHMQEWIGLPTFLLQCLLAAAIVHSAYDAGTTPAQRHTTDAS